MPWTTEKLALAATRFGGGTPSRKEPSYWGGNIPWFTVADLEDKSDIQRLSRSRECITHTGLVNSAAKLIPTGAIVFSSRVVVGKVGIAQNELATNQDFSSFIPSDQFDTEYLAYFLIKSKSDLRTNQRGATIKGVTTKVLDNLDVPKPPKDEQRRIVVRIKECMERVEEIEGLQTEAMQERDYLLESLIEAEYQQAEGEQVTLADVCSITSVLVDPREQQYIDLLHIGGGNIEAKTSKLLDLKTAREEKLKSSKFTFDGTMVLYNKIRPYLMKVARPDFSGLCSADMYPLSPDHKKLTRDYLFYLLLSRNFTEYAIAGSNRAGMPKVNRKHLFAYKFTLPSIDKQHEITEALDAATSVVEKLRADMTATVSETSALRESILRKAFAGEL